MLVDIYLFGLFCSGQNRYFLLSINVGKILLHALSIAHHAGKFWLLDHVLKLSFCICLVSSYIFHFPKVLLSNSFLHGSIPQVCHFWVNHVKFCWLEGLANS